MQVWLFKSLALFAALAFVSQNSSAQTASHVKVLEGQYLIRPKLADRQAGTQSASDVELYKPGVSLFSVGEKVVDFDPSDNTCAGLLASGEASFCEPNFYVEAYAYSNDPMFSSLYGMNQMGAPQAWDRSTGSSSVVVAVIDTGVDYNHSDLAANIWTNPGEIAGNGIDDDGNGWVDDVHGINAYTNTGDPLDDNGHGTHVSGTIGAVGNNGVGVIGVNWNVKIMGLKFLSAGGGGSIFGAIKAIRYLIDQKVRYGLDVKVANNSWGGSGYSKALEDSIREANDAGIIFVAAAGNESTNNDVLPSYPANFDVPNVVSVAAIDSEQALAFFSNYGVTNVDIAAPGVSILSTLPSGQYGSLSGTSMATPHVSGALALLSSYDQSLSSALLIERLYSSAKPVSGLAGKIRTGAMLNAAGMLGISGGTTPSNPSDGSLSISKVSLRTTDGSSAINPGDGLRISVVSASSSASAGMDMFLNNKKCEQAALVSLEVGKNNFRAKANITRSTAAGIKSLSIKIGDRRASKRVSVSSSRRSVSTRKLSSSSFRSACLRISRTLR